ncbi:MAG: ATP synthase F1 subunit delta [Ignavibacteriae bacterium 37-53-5]|nr:MAG: ATP synthase F1 subunit delta [Ignavibacteriae bacterium 37-53-5]
MRFKRIRPVVKGSRASRRYAGALLELAAELKKVDQVSADMRLIRGAISASRDLELFFASPVIDRSKKKGVIRALFEAKVDKMTMSFLLLLVEKGRESLLAGIVVEYADLLDEMMGIVNAELKAPFEFDEKHIARARVKLEEITSKKVRMSFSLDKSLVGGFLAQIGDTVYDGSVRRQLELLKRRLTENASFTSPLTQ